MWQWCCPKRHLEIYVVPFLWDDDAGGLNWQQSIAEVRLGTMELEHLRDHGDILVQPQSSANPSEFWVNSIRVGLDRVSSSKFIVISSSGISSFSLFALFTSTS